MTARKDAQHHSLDNVEMQTKTTRYHFTPTSITNQKDI